LLVHLPDDTPHPQLRGYGPVGTSAVEQDTDTGAVREDPLGECVDVLLLGLNAACAALYVGPADGALTPLVVRGTVSSPLVDVLAQPSSAGLRDGLLGEGFRHITVPPAPLGVELTIVDALRRAGLSSLLLVPLVDGEKTLGLLAAAWRTAYPLGPREIRLARLGAKGATRTLADRSLSVRLSKGIQYAALADQIAASSSTEPMCGHLLPKILASVADLVGSPAGLIALRQDDDGIARVAAVHRLSADLVGRVAPLGPGAPEAGPGTEQGDGRVRHNTYPRGHPLRALYDTPTWLTVPLGHPNGRGQPGVLALAAGLEQRFDAADLRITQFFAGLVTLSLEKAKLLARAQQAAALEERQRIARDLHDSVTQTLVGLQTMAQAALDAWETQPAQARAALESVLHFARGASVEMRTLLFDLRDGTQQGAGLADVLEKHVAVVRHQSGLEVDLEMVPDLRLPPSHEEVVYRVVQEALANVVKHARARRAGIMIVWRDGGIGVRIEDDGVGFSAEGPAFDAFGLRGMRERVQALGGMLQVGNGRTGGAYICALLPLSSPLEASVTGA
jgi:signal transduction histidine kinase